jgi:hypothetical protein
MVEEVIQVKFDNQALVFGTWQLTDTTVINDRIVWSKPLTLLSDIDFNKEGICFEFEIGRDVLWRLKWRTHTLLFTIYFQMFPNPPKYELDQIEEAKQHIDKFLHRVNNLTAFL